MVATFGKVFVESQTCPWYMGLVCISGLKWGVYICVLVLNFTQDACVSRVLEPARTWWVVGRFFCWLKKKKKPHTWFPSISCTRMQTNVHSDARR